MTLPGVVKDYSVRVFMLMRWPESMPYKALFIGSGAGSWPMNLFFYGKKS